MKNYTNGSEMIKYLVILGDFILLNLLFLFFIKVTPDILPRNFQDHIRSEVLLANLCMMCAQYFFHTIIHLRKIKFSVVMRRLAQLVFTQAILTFTIGRLLGSTGGNFEFTIIYVPVLYILLLLARSFELYLLKRYREMGGNTRRVIFIGSDPANLAVYKDLISDPSTGYLVQGYYATHQREDWPEKLEYLGTKEDFEQYMTEHEGHEEENYPTSERIHDVFCCISHAEEKRIMRIIDYCDRHLIHFYYVPRMVANNRLNLRAEQFGRFSLFTNVKEPLSDMGNRFVKRTFDIVMSSLICLCMLPFLPIIALIIKLQSPGPIFFVQTRTGIDGKSFRCYKFRSMHVNKDADMQQATLDDPRKFPFGKIMRKTNLDEFPQFFNVLKGDMSIVGPRPHMLLHTEKYSELIGQYMVRHYCKPGITGWAQVTGFRGETKELWQMEGRVERDIWYIENWSFLLDLKIIMMTAKSIFKPDKNAY